MAAIGLVANPASGKDIRRLVARASVFDNNEKRAIVRRCLAGIAAVDPTAEIHFLADSHNIAASALEGSGLTSVAVEFARNDGARDTTRAASEFRARGCGAVLTLGGDGTNRAFAKGWPDATLVPISTGTNNVFPVLTEATVAGAAAALVATATVPLGVAADQVKLITVEVEDGADDLALIDAVLTTDRFVGARAIVDASHLLTAVLTRAEPAAVGISAIGGLLQPISSADDAGLQLMFGSPTEPTATVVHAPIAPGQFADIGIQRVERLALHTSVQLRGPGTLAFDGERERPLKPDQVATLTLTRNGPHVVDVPRTLAAAAECGYFIRRRDCNAD